MKRRLCCFSVLVGMIVSAGLFAQNVPDLGGPLDAQLVQQSAGDTSSEQRSPLDAALRKRHASARKLQEMKRKLKQFKDDAQFENVVRSNLGQFFDDDLAYRKQQLEQLAKRIEWNEAQFKQRLQARDELINLQLRSFQLDAQGLGLTTDPTQSAVSQMASISPGRRSISITQPLSAQPANQFPSTFSGAAGMTAAVPSKPRSDALVRIRRARQALAQSKDGDSEKKSIEELKTALGEYFDSDMNVRRSELDALKRELSELEEKLTERANAKDEIIELQRKMIVNEANGLGFFRKDANLRANTWTNTASTPVAR